MTPFGQIDQHMRAKRSPASSDSVSVRLADYYQSDMLGLRYEIVKFGAKTSLGSPNSQAQNRMIQTERTFVELMGSGRKLEASREGSE